jgi:hypothetical protein
MWCLIRNHAGGCGFVAIKAFPLQFTEERDEKKKSEWQKNMKYGSFPLGLKASQKKLVSSYKKLGFVPVGDEGCYGISHLPCAADTERSSPLGALDLGKRKIE